MSQKNNPSEFGYLGNEEIVITANELVTLIQATEFFLDKETEKKIPFKFKHVNRETGAEISKVTEKNKHLALKIVDIQKTLDSDKVLSLTPDGVELLKVKMMLEGIHVANIDKGVAKHWTEIKELTNPSVPAIEAPTEAQEEVTE